MSATSEWAVQQAVYLHLSAESALTALLAEGADSVFDHVPAKTAFPYVAIGDMTAEPFSTQDSDGRDITLTIHVYSRYPGLKEARIIAAALHDSLNNAAFSVSGHTLVMCRETGTETLLEADGETRRASMRFRIITEPLS